MPVARIFAVCEDESVIGSAFYVMDMVEGRIFWDAAFTDVPKAERGAWRVQESTLLLLALIGGTPGAYAGRQLFRHKTRKQPFSSQLFSIAVLQVVALGAMLGWWLV